MWNDLVTTALVGTERRALDLQSVPENFRDLTRQLEGQDSERALLALAGAMTLHQRVGAAPTLDTSPLLRPCDLDDLPPCSPRAGLYLQQILALSQHTSHLQEWLALAARRGQRVSEEYLPRLLSAFENRQTLPDHFYDVLGKRGRWLAQQNEGWSYAVLPQSDDEWEFASLPARLVYLRHLRTSDPAHGRALIESVWKSETATHRESLLKTLEAGLTLEDELFLEKILDERSSVVQQVAASLLVRLPESAYSQRMSTRAVSAVLIHWMEHPFGKKLVINLKPPEAWDESLGHDGIEREPPGLFSLETSYYWLFGILQKLSSAYWLGGDWSASDLVQTAADDPLWCRVLLEAMARTVERERNDLLAAALLQVSFTPHEEALTLSGARPETREAYVLRALQAAQKANDMEAFQLLRRLCNVDHPWSKNLTRAVIDTIAQALPHKTISEVSAISGDLPTFAQKMSPDCVEDLQALANIENKSKPSWKPAVKKAVSTLEFRRDMHKEFSR